MRGAAAAESGVGWRMALRFAILGDVHVSTRAVVPQAFERVVALVPALAPRFVVLGGDATSGNAGDGVPLPRVRAWWTAYRAALEPLRAAGIPSLPIAGNHDWYTEAHRKGFDEAWQDLAAEIAPLVAAGFPPHSYSIDVD